MLIITRNDAMKVQVKVTFSCSSSQNGIIDPKFNRPSIRPKENLTSTVSPTPLRPCFLRA